MRAEAAQLLGPLLGLRFSGVEPPAMGVGKGRERVKRRESDPSSHQGLQAMHGFRILRSALLLSDSAALQVRSVHLD